MNEDRKKYLLKAVRSRDFRRALKAIAELRSSGDAGLVDAVAQPDRPEEQLAFQSRIARIVLEKGIEGLVAEWATLGDAKWRALLIREIGQFLDLWVDRAVIELALAALEDSSRELQVNATWMLLAFVKETSAKERKAVKGESARRFLDAADTIRGWITPGQRSRMTRALAGMLGRRREDPYPVVPELVVLLGYAANKEDRAVIEQLEALHSTSGDRHRVSYERVDKTQFRWFDRLIMAKKGVAPNEIVRIKYTPTGLIDRNLLEESLARIKARAP